MAINLNGSSQGVEIGDAVDLARTTLPFTAAFHHRPNATALAHYETLYKQGPVWYGGSGGGHTLLVENVSSPRYEVGLHWSGSTYAVLSTLTIDRTVWHTVLLTFRDRSGGGVLVDILDYNHQTRTLTANAGLTATTNTGSLSAPATGWVTAIGFADNSATAGIQEEDWYGEDISWAAFFAGDLTNQGSTSAPAVWELIARGPWGMLDPDCLFFMPFCGAARDLSGNGKHGTLNNAPSYVGSGIAGELPPSLVVPVLRQPPPAGGGPTYPGADGMGCFHHDPHLFPASEFARRREALLRRAVRETLRDRRVA